ncbi:MAG: hypothetical protein AABX73_02675 [Nanoarchaeota archaeon]
MSMKDFFCSLKNGQKLFGEDVAIIVNSALLSLVYLIGVGLTFLAAKLTGKKFLDLKIDEEKSTYWQDINTTKGSMEEYYRQF